ncbi:MAG: ribosomal protein S27AE, partial [Paraglaciecola sp.]
QAVIIKAAESLVQRLGSFCPQCSNVDFAVEHAKVRYLFCELCTLPTNQTQPKDPTCGHCGYYEAAINEYQKGSAFYCNFCNP